MSSETQTEKELHPNITIGAEYPLHVLVELDQMNFGAAEVYAAKYEPSPPFKEVEAELTATYAERNKSREESGIGTADCPFASKIAALNIERFRCLFGYVAEALFEGRHDAILSGMRMPITPRSAWVSYNSDRLSASFAGTGNYQYQWPVPLPKVSPDEVVQTTYWEALTSNYIRLRYTAKIVDQATRGGSSTPAFALFRFEVWLRDATITRGGDVKREILAQNKPLHVFYRGLQINGLVYREDSEDI